MTKPVFKEIDGIRYACTMMPGRLANRTLTRLTLLVGRPALVMAAGAIELDKDKTEDQQEKAMVHLIRIGVDQVFRGLTPEEADEVLMSLMSGVKYEGLDTHLDLSDPVTFDDHFRGALLRAYKVWGWALGVNYKDFIDAARSSRTLSKVQAVGTQVLNTKISTLLSQESAPQTEE